jgi:hypothetical protein
MMNNNIKNFSGGMGCQLYVVVKNWYPVVSNIKEQADVDSLFYFIFLWND